MRLQGVLDDVLDEVGPLVGNGVPALSIPALRHVDVNRVGIAVATVDGRVHGAGAWSEPFSIQSVSKLFALALVFAHDGEALWKRVQRQPSSLRYDALIQLDLDCGIPRNPFVNAGALAVVDRLLTLRGDAGAAVVAFLRAESGNPDIGFDPTVAASEQGVSHRNAAAAHLMAAHGNLDQGIDDVLTHYIHQCAIAASCADLARAGLFLARAGRRNDGERLLTGLQTRRLNSILLTCGTYDAAGDVAYHVGLPAKSGIGGGVLAIVPGRGAVCAWSPGLDEAGNSIAAMAALHHFSEATGWSVF
ncbi:glutaminase [Streptomyces sp. SID3343]|uniref:glutaminase n=1 Tax=Streptomyces sp. SID3343 TaxID=2690260 RepID=UPI00136C4DB8|nr:glutaminase [Streptomyces sp. SID3343]MYW05744.1 glutaminase [Streptomyces sp. SID3343]